MGKQGFLWPFFDRHVAILTGYTCGVSKIGHFVHDGPGPMDQVDQAIGELRHV